MTELTQEAESRAKDFDNPNLIQTPESIEAVLVLFGKEAARVAENMTQDETAEYITDFLRIAIARLTGINPPEPGEFQVPAETN